MISMDKQYRTRDGREVKIFMVDGGGSCPVIGAVKLSEGPWVPCNWPADGAMVSGSQTALIEVKPRYVRWVNVYAELGLTREDADSYDQQILSHRIACIRVEFEEGEGLP